MRTLIRSLLCVLFLPAAVQAGQVIFTEVMYHPAGAQPEYIEVTNLTSNRVDMARWTLSGGVDYTFPDFNAGDTAAHFLKEYERVIVSSATPEATRAAWPTLPPTVRVFGPWTGSLNNSGEEIVIKDAAGSVESTLAYGDSGDWPVSADGAGHSLQIINQNANVNDWRNWRASRFAGGSPGVAELTVDEVATTNAEKNDQSVVNYNSAWKYWRQATDPDGAGAEGDWKAPAFDDTAWEGPGPGFFGHDPSNANLQAARGTSFTTGYSLSTVSYYFRTTFNWAGPATGMTFALDQYADDGVVYYLNGQELRGANLGRVRMPTGVTTHSTLATTTPTSGDAVEELNVLSGSLDGQLITGVNVLSAEVHQNNISGDDIYFGARLKVSAPSPGGIVINEVRPAAVAGAGFVEFYNPTAATIDLNGFYLSDVESNPRKFQITTPTPVPPGGVATVGFAESGLGIGTPVLVVLTKPDGVTRQAGFQLSMVIDGRSAGRKPSGGASWVLFTQPTPGLPNVTTPAATLALSEVDFAATGRVDWVEVVNTGTSSQALNGYYVSSRADLSDRVELSGSLAAGTQGSVTVDFPTDAAGNVTIYLSDARNNILGAAKLQRRAGLPSVQAWPAGSGEWYSTPVATRDAANNPERQTAIVINEIMSKTPADHDEGEYIELYNNSAASVDMSGWRVADGISFDFPAGTSLGAGQYMVLAKSPAYMAANYAGLANVYGPYGGSLKNSGEKIRLEDARRNLADVVDYNSGGQWPVGTAGEGSSLELMHPSMDNNLPSSWRASDESTKTTFQTFTHTGTYKELRGTSPSTSTTRELLVNMVGDGYVILKNIKLTKATNPTLNLITTGDATSHNGTSASGFLCTGTHCESDTLPRTGATITGEPGFHLISRGSGDTKANKAEVDVTGIALNDVLTLSFEGRWVSGLPVMVAQTWDRSFGKVFRFPIPGNLGTPGAVNTAKIVDPAPSVDYMLHSPAVPTSTQSVVVTAKVSSATPLTSVSLVHRLDSVAGNAAWTTVAMNDAGSGGDAVAGDGTWSATVAPRANGSITQFYVTATATNGQANECPRQGVKRPGMWIVANTPPAAGHGLLVQRNIISQYHRAALNKTTGFSAAYDYDHPRMSNYGFNSTMIFNESEVLYNCELRRGGSPWTRIDGNTLDRTRWKPPGDHLFRERSKSGVDNDSTGASRFHNRMVRYLLYLFGYPIPNAEFIVQIVNADSPRIGDEQEQTDSDFFDRAYPGGSNGELYEIDDSWFMYDSNYMDDRLDAGSVTGRWAITDYNGSAAVPSDESPIFYHGNWPTRFPEVRYDYSSLSAMIKAAANNNASVPAAQETAYREKMERVLNVERAAIYAAVRGYVYDWDNFTINRGKNGYFYKPPGDSRFEFHHWDSDLAFQDANNVFLGTAGGIGWSNFSTRPWFRQKMNYYLSELVTRYTSNSPRTTAWLTAMNYQSTNTSSLAAFKTNLYNYQTSWFAPRQTPAINFITSTDYNRAFTCSTVSGLTVTTPVFTLTGACSSKVARVDIPGHPEAIFARTPTAANLGLWTVSNIYLANGVNNLTLRALLSDGTVSATLPFTVTLSVNAPPVVSLISDPSSGNVAAGEILNLDATGSVDPEGLALTYAWSVSPATGVILTEPEFGKATARFSTPGNYTLTLQVTDAVSQTTTLTRQLSVYSADDFASFGGGDPLGAGYTVSNVGNRSNFSPSSWYSLEDITGRLLINVLDDSAKPLAGGAFTHPLITRDLPDSADFVLQTSLLPDTRQFGNWQAGLMVEMNEGGTPVRYVLGVDGGLNLLVQRSAAGAAYATLSTTPVTGVGAVLRVVRSGNALLFQRQSGAAWTTAFTQPLPAGSVAVNGGVFVATSVATHVRIGFDYLLIGDPTDVNTVLNNLRITELHYRPATGGVEFIELKNTGTQSIDLTGVSFALGQPFSMAGVTPTAYTFGALTLAPGEYIVLTENTTLFRSIYGPAARLAPDWTSGNLSNSGEEITLLDPSGNAIHDFTYGIAAPWPAAANGGGPSMEVINLNGDYSQGTNWRAGIAGGSPGYAGPGPDTDGDGAPDAVEALFGTNPANPGSAPAANLTANGAGNMTLTWPSVAGVTYQVQSCTPLSGWVTVQTLVGVGTWTFTPTAGELRRFYRVVAVGP